MKGEKMTNSSIRRIFRVLCLTPLLGMSLSVFAQGPKKPMISQEKLREADRKYTLGYSLLQMGRVDEALEKTKEAVALNPNHAQAQYNLGYLLSQKGRIGEAITHTRLAVKLDPKSARANYNLAYFMQTTGKKDEAISHYRAAAKLDPKAANAHYNLGLLLTEKKTPAASAEAVVHCRLAVELNPTMSSPLCKK